MDRITKLTLDPRTYAIIERIAYASLTEACGILVGGISENGMAIISEVRQIKNISPTPERSFMYAPEEYLKAIEDTNWYDTGAPLVLLGTWHTHPNYPGYPSTTDWNAALKGQVIEGLYFIYSTLSRDLHAYIWDGQTFKVIKRYDGTA